LKKTGFTLIELLVTIVLFSLLLVTVLYSFSFLSINIKNINNTNPIKVINYTLLRGTISSIYSYVQSDDIITNIEKSFYYYFIGKQDKCKFITISPIFYDKIAIAELSIINGKLIYREGKIFDKKLDYTHLNTLVLTKELTVIENISEIKFLYYLNGKEYLEINKKIPSLIKIKFIKSRKDKEYLFYIKSNNKEHLNMIKSQFREF
jgi:prepilin-type N-terminal cleavage/methylation domain-containing protein